MGAGVKQNNYLLVLGLYEITASNRPTERKTITNKNQKGWGRNTPRSFDSTTEWVIKIGIFTLGRKEKKVGFLMTAVKNVETLVGKNSEYL